MAPTSYSWNVVNTIRTDIESFGYSIELSHDGTFMAIASPKSEGGKGRFDIYKLQDFLGEEQHWVPVVADSAQVGESTGDQMSLGMHLSGDGGTVAVGSPFNGNGLVQVFQIDKAGQSIAPKGQPLVGLGSGSQYGYSIALNFDGNILFIGAPDHANIIDEVVGLVQVFDYDTTNDEWVQSGSDIVGSDNGSRFGHSVSAADLGNRVVVGAPLEDTPDVDAGEIHFYELQEGEWFEFAKGDANGESPGSQLGTHVAISGHGFVIASGSTKSSLEEYPEAGLMEIWSADPRCLENVSWPGYPISGTDEGVMFGHDIDVDENGKLSIASGQNNNGNAGYVRIYEFQGGAFEVYGPEIMGPELGTCEWLGKGPSVTIAAKRERIAIGYECVMSNGLSRAEVRVFDYYTVAGRDQ